MPGHGEKQSLRALSEREDSVTPKEVMMSLLKIAHVSSCHSRARSNRL